MAVGSGGKKTEHNGAKNSSHDKQCKRAELKAASRKLRRAADKVAEVIEDRETVIVVERRP